MSRPVQGYLPSLDGWRAIAILSVIQYHDGVYRVGSLSSQLVHDNGSLGVDLFFAISGFLICSRLLDENRKRGFISLRSFYIRRMFRIFPPALAFLAACALLSLAHIIPTDWGGLTAGLLMVRNFWVAHAGDTPANWYTIHFWSLSVEEHFYMLLPGMLVLAGRRRLGVMFTASVITVAWTLIINHYVWLQTPAVWLRTDLRLSSLMVPAFLAVLLSEEKYRRLAIQWLHPVVALGIIAALYFASLRIRTLVPMVVVCGFPLLIISTIYHPQSWLTRILELPPMKFIGHVSYSLYLWQQLFFLMGHERAAWPLSVLQHAILSYLAALTCAVSSYYLLEKPLIRVGHKIAHPVNDGRDDLAKAAKGA
jgi:peptidoglycan/LPS O-acetylase OafA/YrhL